MCFIKHGGCTWGIPYCNVLVFYQLEIEAYTGDYDHLAYDFTSAQTRYVFNMYDVNHKMV